MHFHSGQLKFAMAVAGTRDASNAPYTAPEKGKRQDSGAKEEGNTE